LIRAADLTEGVSHSPRPFVLQTSLDDFYISYQINAYIKDAHSIVKIKSNLHQNIQDEFNRSGVEIMSPHYRSERDGNKVTIPEEWEIGLPPVKEGDKEGRGRE
jgi:small-conductance mechanosensitive channel